MYGAMLYRSSQGVTLEESTVRHRMREMEGLPRTSGAAQRCLKNWTKSLHWRGQGNASAVFMLGVALHVKREVIVLELNEEGAVVDSARIYGLRDGDHLTIVYGHGCKGRPLISSLISGYMYCTSPLMHMRL